MDSGTSIYRGGSTLFPGKNDPQKCARSGNQGRRSVAVVTGKIADACAHSAAARGASEHPDLTL